MSGQSTPSGLAIIVCDQVIEDKLTNKKSLIGIFNSIAHPGYPARHPALCIFVSLTEGRGTCQARLRIVCEETDKPVAEVNGQLEFADVNQVVEMAFNFMGLEFPEPGLYSIEFYCADALVLERRFHALEITVAPQSPPPEEL